MTRNPSPLLALAVGATALLPLLAAVPASAGGFPDTIALPRGYQPEGIASGAGTTFYVGSIPTGRVVVGDYRTGKVTSLVPQRKGRSAIGIKADRGLLFVAGGGTGTAFVYDAGTGADVARYQLTASSDTFINDVTLTRDAAWFTDSRNQVLHRVARSADGRPGKATSVPLTGDLVYRDGFNLNGIAATPDGATLYAVQSNTGALFRIDPTTGRTTRIALMDATGGPTSLTNGDGILLEGKTLYVVQNRDNVVATVDLARGVVVSRSTDSDFAVPTTIARQGSSLYAVNAKFGADDPAQESYSVVRIDRPRR